MRPHADNTYGGSVIRVPLCRSEEEKCPEGQAAEGGAAPLISYPTPALRGLSASHPAAAPNRAQPLLPFAAPAAVPRQWCYSVNL
jgi:hypothetical protein